MQTLQTLSEFAYARHALVAAAAIGLVCSLLSVIIVLKRMAFIGQGISHAGFGGVGTAFFLGMTGLSQDLIVLIFCLGTAIGIGLLSRSRKIETDSAIGIWLAAAMAWGVLMPQLRISFQAYPWYRDWFGTFAYMPSWESLLFGSLFNVGAAGMWAAVGLCVLVIAICAALYKELVFFTFDETVSRVFGVRTGIMYYLLMTLLALVIVVSIRLVGFILVSSLLIVPGATAIMLSRRMGYVLALAAGTGLVGTVGGLMLSLELGDVSPGASIALLLFLLFVLSFFVGRFLQGRRSDESLPTGDDSAPITPAAPVDQV